MGGEEDGGGLGWTGCSVSVSVSVSGECECDMRGALSRPVAVCVVSSCAGVQCVWYAVVSVIGNDSGPLCVSS